MFIFDLSTLSLVSGNVFVDLNHGEACSTPRLNACPVCGKRFRLAAHSAKHVPDDVDKRPYVCCLCCKRFMKKSSFTEHFYEHGMRHDRDERSVFRCTICHWSSSNFNELGKHALTEHGVARFELGEL